MTRHHGLSPRLLLLLLLLCTPAGCKQESTTPNLDGKWVFTLTSSKGAERDGVVEIRQQPGQPSFSLRGQVENLDTKELEVAFSSKIAGIDGNEVYFIYENQDRELGAAMATISDLVPRTLRFRYYDCYRFDRNKDPYGILDMERVMPEDE